LQGEPRSWIDDDRIRSSVGLADEDQVEPSADGGGGRDPRRGGERRGQRLAHPPDERGGEGRGEHPHGELGPRVRRGARRREVEASRGPEEQEQVEVGEADEGAVVAADAEREVGPEGEEGRRVGPRDAAGRRRRRGVRARDGGRVARHGLRAADRYTNGGNGKRFLEFWDES
jgi:hypothetical protein